MSQLEPVLEIITLCISCFSILVLVWGVFLSAKDFFVIHFKTKNTRDKIVKLAKSKHILGRYVLLSLEVLIVADIIESIVHPNLEDILRLAAIVAIRTVISFFLNKEIREATLTADDDD